MDLMANEILFIGVSSFFTSVQAYTLKNENSLISQLNDRVQSDIRILGAKEKTM